MPPDAEPPPGPAAPAPLWVDGAFTLRVHGPGGDASWTLEFDRPYALVGRIVGADVRIDDPAVSARHAYLHLDRRGLFAVDLATRGGTRVGDLGRPAGWLAPGQSLEVAGYRIEVVDYRVDGATPERPAGHEDDDPLADAGPSPLTRVTLYPAREPESPMVLGSELVFLGRSPSCGVRVDGESASRTHCVLVRARRAAYLIELVGRGTWLNHRPLRGGVALTDGDLLMVGSAQFEVRVEAPRAGRPAPARESLPAELGPQVPSGPAELLTSLPPLPPDVVPAESQAAVLAWMMGVLQAGQSEILRQQAEFQRSMAQMVRQIHLDNTALLSKHMERVDAINRELASLRDEIRHRFGPADGLGRPAAALPQPPPLRIAPHVPPSDTSAATSWLLDRVHKLEQENRSTWRDFLTRLGKQPQRPA
jgi:pSer/pThr/pTyr-binding forkhead associated (FHA) protein